MVHFIIVPSLNLNFLNYFSQENQKQFGKIKVHFNLSWLFCYSQYLAQTDFVLLNNYK